MAPAVVPIIRAWHTWLCVEKGFSPHTQYGYLQDLKALAQFYQTYRSAPLSLESLRDMEVTTLRAFLVARRQEGVSARSRTRGISALKSFYCFLKRCYQIQNDAIYGLSRQKLDQLLPRPLPVEKALQLVALPHHADPFVRARDQALLTLLYGTGLRLGEALQLNIADVPPAGAALKVRGKGNKERLVPLLSVVQQKIALYLIEHPEPDCADAPLFLGVQGGRLHPGAVQRLMRHLRPLLDLPDTTTPHSLRHSFASHLLASDVDLRSLQQLLGHESLASTQHYTGVDIGRLQHVHARSHPRGRHKP